MIVNFCVYLFLRLQKKKPCIKIWTKTNDLLLVGGGAYCVKIKWKKNSPILDYWFLKIILLQTVQEEARVYIEKDHVQPSIHLFSQQTVGLNEPTGSIKYGSECRGENEQ